MIYRLKEFKGDTIPVPQLVFSKLGIAEEYNVRVALYVLATGITDPEKLCADLKLRSKMTAESALSFWAGAGLLERYEENAAPGEEPTAPAPMTWSEIAAASRTDPMISSLIDCAQTSFARPLDPPNRSKERRNVNLLWSRGRFRSTDRRTYVYVVSSSVGYVTLVGRPGPGRTERTVRWSVRRPTNRNGKVTVRVGSGPGTG